MSQISNFYAEKNIFITGATGFLGKVLVEKLVRDCGDLSKIYLLVRPKKGLDSKQRCQDYLEHIVFDRVRRENPSQLKKIRVLKGDVTETNLGLEPIDENELIENVHIIFHCAANVRFDMTLKDAVNFNLKGTHRILTLALKIRNLISLVHVSTSYCNCEEIILEERHYPSKEDPFLIMETVDTMSDEALNSITPKLLGKLPNTYALTKGYSEHLVYSYGEKLPIVIARPPIITAAWKNPMLGYVEGLTGPTGLLVAAAKGVLRTMHCNPKFSSQAIPVDIITNCIVALAHKRTLLSSDHVYFCNITDCGKNSLTWGESLELGKQIFYEYPLSTACLFYPNGSMKTNYFVHKLCVIFFHYIPAYVVDGLLFLMGYEPFLVNVQKRVSQGLNVLQYYTTREWIFKNDNFKALYQEMNEYDKEIFYCDLSKIDYSDYILNYILGIRKFVLHDSMDSLPQARAKLQRLYFVDKLVKSMFYVLLIFILIKYFFN